MDGLVASLGKRISKVHKEMLINTAKALKGAGYRVVFGSPDELRKWEGRNYPNNTDNAPFVGKINTQTKVIYISNDSTETIVHELIHAATIDKTVAFYKNKGNLSPTDQGALTRIEGLMNEWLAASFEDESDDFTDANRSAVMAIRQRLADGQKAAALNEFMAWSLSNQAIVAVQQKTKVQNPALKLIGDALTAIWRMVWGTKFAPNSGDTIYSNLRFNTRVLLATPARSEYLREALDGLTLYQSPVYGSSDRISNITAKFVSRINSFIKKGDPLYQVNRQQSYDSAVIDATQVADTFLAQGFSMNMQQKFLFQTVQAAFAIAMKFNTNSQSAMQDIYSHVMGNLKLEDFMSDRNSTDPNVRYEAQKKFDLINGRYGITKDAAGRSNLLSSFLALALVDDQFREIISGIKPPAKFKSEETGLNGILETVGMGAMDAMGDLLAGAKRDQNLLMALDGLVNHLHDVATDQQTFIENQITNGVDAIDNYAANNAQNLSQKVLDKTVGKKDPASRLVRMVATAINAKASSEWAEGVISLVNKANGFNTMREMISEIIGRPKDGAIFDMITRVRSAIQQVRQQYREHLPEVLAKRFTRTLSASEWSLMFKGFAKTDLSSLYDTVGLKKTLSMVTNQNDRDARIAELEKELLAVDITQAATQIRKSKDLAKYLITGKTNINHLRNAYAVTHMLRESTQVPLGTKDKLVPVVDQLITLYALNEMSKSDLKDLTDLINEQPEGVNNTVAFLIGERKTELEKTKGRAKVNGYKGYIPSDNQLGTSLVVVSDREYGERIAMGYIRIGDYEGSPYDNSRVNRGYYFSPISGKATYNQGVLQTVHNTASGVDPHTGYTMDITAGRITDPALVAIINASSMRNGSNVENLEPIFDTNGDVVAYERGIDAQKLTHLKRNTNLSEMMGAWIGRQYEEKLALAFNTELINKLNTIWKEGEANGRADEFVDLSTSKDPIHQDTWKLVTNETKDIIKGTFGTKFMVRKDMINDAVGFRSVSVGDLWTGNNRMKPAVQEQIRKSLMGIFGLFGTKHGAKAFEYLVKSETVIQNVVTEAKVLIVVKSVIVPVSNMVSNVLQLMNRGVPLRTIIHGLGSKTAEINDFIKRRQRQLVLEADLRSADAVNDLVTSRRITNELRTIKDSYKRMSIYPLIKAGEFTSISDGGVTQEDIALAEGKWGQFIEKMTNKVPNALQTPVKYALITRDTALFQGLTRAVQYGDFIAKAIMYDDMVNRKKASSEDALIKIGEEFINYSRLSGRNRNYLESMGLIWFWNFKLRSMKVAVSMIRENPFRAFMATNFAPFDVGSPITDNFAAVLRDGKLGYSMGTGMLWNSMFLNPWLNIIK